jgi:hypothetical protein
LENLISKFPGRVQRKATTAEYHDGDDRDDDDGSVTAAGGLGLFYTDEIVIHVFFSCLITSQRL